MTTKEVIATRPEKSCQDASVPTKDAGFWLAEGAQHVPSIDCIRDTKQPPPPLYLPLFPLGEIRAARTSIKSHEAQAASYKAFNLLNKEEHRSEIYTSVLSTPPAPPSHGRDAGHLYAEFYMSPSLLHTNSQDREAFKPSTSSIHWKPDRIL